jgi:hypothetical protein
MYSALVTVLRLGSPNCGTGLVVMILRLNDLNTKDEASVEVLLDMKVQSQIIDKNRFRYYQ